MQDLVEGTRTTTYQSIEIVIIATLLTVHERVSVLVVTIRFTLIPMSSPFRQFIPTKHIRTSLFVE